SVTCFFSSYLVVLGLELLRLAGRIPGRALGVIAMTLIGIFTHVTFLFLRALDASSDFGVLATWSDWAFLVALGLSIGFLVFYLRRPETVISFFFLPTILVMILLGWSVRSLPPFSRSEAVGVWRGIHGLSMVAGTAIVLFGFLAGMMYLAQSWRLKNHRAGSKWKLPTLETSMRWNRTALLWATIAVGIGVAAGVMMNLNRTDQVGWLNRDVLLSFGLFAWLCVACGIDRFAGQLTRSRRTVYLTIASAVFLAAAVVSVLSGSHGASENPADTARVLIPMKLRPRVLASHCHFAPSPHTPSSSTQPRSPVPVAGRGAGGQGFGAAGSGDKVISQRVRPPREAKHRGAEQGQSGIKLLLFPQRGVLA
ncbi:MAG: hypothetical protein AAF958_20230, partial [Planctomycetota bacterium]